MAPSFVRTSKQSSPQIPLASLLTIKNENMKTFTTTLTILSLFLSTVYGDSYYGICKVSDQNCHYTLVINGKGSDAQAGCAKLCPLPKRELDSDLRYKEIKANLLFFVFLDRGSIDA